MIGIIDSGVKIITNGLVAWFDAAQTRSYSGSGTTWTNLSSTGNLTLNNGPAFDSGNGGSIDFDGTNDYASGLSFNASGGFTLECWQKFDSLAAGYQGFFGAGTTQPANTSLFWGRFDSGFALYFNSNDNLYSWSPSTSSWYHHVMTYNSTTYVKEWILNGTMQTPTSRTSNSRTFANPEGFNVGCAFGFGFAIDPLNGKMAIVRAYTRVLSESEAANNYNAEKSRFGL